MARINSPDSWRFPLVGEDPQSIVGYVEVTIGDNPVGRVGNGTYESVVARALQFQQFETAEFRTIEVPELSALGVAFVNGTDVELVDAVGGNGAEAAGRVG